MKVDLVCQNLIDLHGLPTYQQLTGASGFPKVELTGMTAARVTPALEAMSELYQHFDLLLKTVDRATELRKQVRRFLGSEQINEIEQILTGPSIDLPSVQTPLVQRGLLTASETAKAIAPEKLLALMNNAFQTAKDAVIAVDEAWLRLPTLADAEAETISLQQLANSLGIGNLSELSAARQQIASLRASLESDPLGVSADLDREINPLILRVKTTLQQVVKQQTQLQEELASAQKLLKKLVELHACASTVYAESTLKVVESSLQTPSTQEIDALKAWLRRLDAKFAEGLLHPVRIGLENWTAKVKEYTVAVEGAYVANKTLLETRAELRGRLEALKAKALAQGLVEDATLTELAEQAKQLLYTRPTPLEKAAELTSQYQKRLNNLVL